MPAGQGVHDVAVVVVEYVPAKQSKHVLPPSVEYCPAMHAASTSTFPFEYNSIMKKSLLTFIIC